MTSFKIYHNPRCSKSRQTLDIIQQQGYQPEIIKYLESPPSVSELKKILSLLKIQPRELMRENEKDYKENNMRNPSLSTSQLIDLMHKFPKVIERPIVLNKSKAVIGRPPESVLSIL
jgi:arsenate reductase